MVRDVVTVKYREYDVGAVSFDVKRGVGFFEYEPRFLTSGIELSPLKMPLSPKVFSFPEVDYDVFRGLPGMIADSLPDDFGNAVTNAWIASQGKSMEDITPVQRLQYTGKRGMGALTYHPASQRKKLNASLDIEIQSLVAIAQAMLEDHEHFSVTLEANGQEDREAMLALMSVGMSAGGARPKAVLAFNHDFTQVRSGQTDAPPEFTHYLMKFDGVSEQNRNRETFGDPMGYGVMEYVYHLMATSCGISMMPCSLLNEGNRRHFITQRFDRKGNEKIHVQTLNGLAHISYKRPGSCSYAEVMATARLLKLGAEDALQLFKRMAFNIVARNHDDHSKNFGFMLDDKNQWQLSPAYDVAYSYKPGSPWVNSHWMTLNGKRDQFTRNDFYSFEKLSPLFSRKKIDMILNEIIEHVSKWHKLAMEYEVPRALVNVIGENIRLKL